MLRHQVFWHDYTWSWWLRRMVTVQCWTQGYELLIPIDVLCMKFAFWSTPFVVLISEESRERTLCDFLAWLITFFYVRKAQTLLWFACLCVHVEGCVCVCVCCHAHRGQRTNLHVISQEPFTLFLKTRVSQWTGSPQVVYASCPLTPGDLDLKITADSGFAVSVPQQ